MGGQLFDAATSVAANYRAACKGRSHSEFVAKLGFVVEEADEAGFWLDLMIATSVLAEAAVTLHRAEASELTAIFTASHKTASARKRSGKARRLCGQCQSPMN